MTRNNESGEVWKEVAMSCCNETSRHFEGSKTTRLACQYQKFTCNSETENLFGMRQDFYEGPTEAKPRLNTVGVNKLYLSSNGIMLSCVCRGLSRRLKTLKR